ncbi:MAG: YceI family protein [Pseudomonadota bacterium]
MSDQVVDVDEIEAGTFEVLPDRSSVELKAASPLGTLIVTLPAMKGTVDVAAGGQIEGCTVSLDPTALKVNAEHLRGALEGEGGLDIANHREAFFEADTLSQDGPELVMAGTMTARGVDVDTRVEGVIHKAQPRRIVLIMTAHVDRTKFGMSAGRPMLAKSGDVVVKLVAKLR